MNKTNKNIFLLFILLIAGLRFYKLGQLPSGINADEASIGYDAYSILKTGRDQWGDFLPLNYFKSFGDYKLPVHFYLTVPSILIFGLNEFAIRLPAALAGFLSVFLTYFLTYELFRKGKYENYAFVLALLSAFLLAISPWHFVLSRTGHEISLSVFLIILGMLLFLRNDLLFFLAFFLGFYTYHTARIFILLILPFLFFLYRKKALIKSKLRTCLLVYFLLFLTPFLLNFFSKTGGVRILQTTGIPKVGMINQVNEKRGVCFQFLPTFLCRFFYNRLEVFGVEYLKNYLNHFSPFTLFTHGVQGVDTFSLAKRGLFYLFELPFILIGGFYLFLKSKNRYRKLLAVWLLLYPIPASLTGFDNSRRMMLLLPLFQILGALGILISWQTIKDKKNQLLRFASVVFFSILIIFSFSRFLVDFLEYNIANSRDFKNGFKEMIAFVKANEDKYEKIYISNYYDYAYIHYLFFTKFDPLRFQENIKMEMVKKEFVGEWVKVAQIGKIYFFDKLAWQQVPANSLFVVAPYDRNNLIKKENQATKRVIKTIRNLNNEPVFEIIEIR